ncbi:hypothetical protein [Enterobacter sp. SA187]|uniref:hypothetical protein n=1 Tax=Enterobacter sp. SA187 TaxID=1914861 RepID=UPI00093509F4|nr:hypothetical protein [Enterobacter sp. SA187]
MKEQMAKMTIIELVRTAHNYATSIKQTGVYSDLVGEIASRLEALNLAYIGLTKKSNGMQSERDQLSAQLADVVAENAELKAAIQSHSESVHFCELCGKDDPCSTDDICYVLKETPATDRFLAEQQSIGIQKAADSGLFSNWVNQSLISFAITVRNGDDFAAQLRNEVKV